MADDKIIKNPNRKNGPPDKKAYVPEWVRLEREPLVNKVNPNDFLMESKRKRKVIPAPTQTKVSVGLKENWFDAAEDPKVSEEILYDDVPDPPSEEFEEEVSEPELESAEFNPEPVKSPLKPGEYGLFVKGVFVVKTTSAEEIKEAIETIIFDNLPNFSGISLEDITLVKRIDLKVGIIGLE